MKNLFNDDKFLYLFDGLKFQDVQLESSKKIFNVIGKNKF